jgi:hypothetical protein
MGFAHKSVEYGPIVRHFQIERDTPLTETCGHEGQADAGSAEPARPFRVAAAGFYFSHIRAKFCQEAAHAASSTHRQIEYADVAQGFAFRCGHANFIVSVMTAASAANCD